MRSLRVFLLGLTSIYPIYWTAQFALFFLPPALGAIFFRLPMTIVDISFLQAAALSGKSGMLPSGVESLLWALLFSFAIWYLRGDRFLTGGLAIVILGQSAVLPFLKEPFWAGRSAATSVFGLFLSLGIICFGLYRILCRTGGADFVERLALLSLLAALPEAALWFAFRVRYPSFGTEFLLMLLVPLYLGALVASALPHRLARGLAGGVYSPAPPAEILAGFVVACLLLTAIGLSSRSGERQRPTLAHADLRVHSL